MQKAKNFVRCKQGSVGLIFGILAVPMLLGIGAAVEYSQTYNLKSDLQNYSDAAVLYGISSESEKEELASEYFTSQVDVVYGENVTFDPTYDEETGILSATANVSFEPVFMKLAGIGSIDIEVSAEAILSPQPQPNCIYLMHPNASQAFIMNEGAVLDAPDCGVQVHSNNSVAAVFNQGINPGFREICIEGPGVLNNFGNIPQLETNCEAEDNPFVNQIPAPASQVCDYRSRTYSAQTVNLQPGVYCGFFNFNSGVSTINLEPGHYILRNGGWNVRGDLISGEEVTFYYADSSFVQFSRGIRLDITPPETGVYENILFHEREGLPERFLSWNDSSEFNVSGVMYLPSRRVQYNSDSEQLGRNMTMVFRTLTINKMKLELTSVDTGGTEETVRLLK